MASLSTAALAPLSSTITHKTPTPNTAFFNPLPVKATKTRISYAKGSAKLQVRASLKEKMATGLTAAALAAASMVMPDIAEAADYSSSPSLKNFLLSIAAGGVVVTAIIGAVVGVSNFDPVKRA